MYNMYAEVTLILIFFPMQTSIVLHQLVRYKYLHLWFAFSVVARSLSGELAVSFIKVNLLELLPEGKAFQEVLL